VTVLPAKGSPGYTREPAAPAEGLLARVLWNPIIAKELQTRMRGWHSMALLTGFLCVTGGFGYLVYSSAVAGSVSVVQVGAVGDDLFSALAVAVLVVIPLVVPGLVSPAISGEREHKTLDLLLVTPLHPARIVVGKLVAATAFVVLLIVAAVPLFSVAFLLGGVALSQVAELLCFALVGVVCIGSVGMFVSTAVRHTSTATVVAYLAMLALVAGPLVAGYALDRAFDPGSSSNGLDPGYQALSGAPGVVYSLSPLVGADGVLQNGACNTDALSFPAPFSGTAFGCGSASLYTTDLGPLGTWRTWELTLLAEGALTVAALGGSVWLLRRRDLT